MLGSVLGRMLDRAELALQQADSASEAGLAGYRLRVPGLRLGAPPFVRGRVIGGAAPLGARCLYDLPSEGSVGRERLREV